MLIIAHRGLTAGPNAKLQNNPAQVEIALAVGFDAEIDVWYLDNKYYLGHDTPDYEVSWQWLSQPNLWLHCKNLPAFFDMRSRTVIHNYFWHESDSVVLTSRGNIWTYLGKIETQSPDSICVMPEVTYTWYQIEKFVKDNSWGGICTDYPEKVTEWLK